MPEPVKRTNPIDVLTGGEVPHSLRTTAGVVWRLLVIGAGIYVLVLGIGQLVPVILALFFALIITALAEPIVRRLKPHLPDALAVVLTLLTLTVAVFAVFAFVVKSVIDQAPQLSAELTSGFTQITNWLANGPLHIDASKLDQIPTLISNWLQSQAGNIAKFALGEVSSLFTFITAASVFMFAGFFFLYSPDKLWSWFIGWMPPKARPAVGDAGGVAWGTMSGYVRGIILVALADATLVLIGLLILGIPLAPVLAVVVFFGALIPIIGAPIATMLAAVVALATEGPVKALLVVALTIVVGSVDGDVLQPLIMGKAVSLHPLAIVTVLAIGTISGGLLGALVCVPVAATIYALAKYLTGRTVIEPAVASPSPD
jgi:hypothetical protein